MFFVPNTGRNDDQRGHRADDQRIDQRFEHGHRAFAHRLIGLGGGVRDGRRTLAGFVGKEATFYAPQQRDADDARDRAADGRRRIKGAGDDEHESARDLVGVEHQDDEGAGHIEGGHRRGEGRADARDAANTAKDNGADEDRDEQSDDPRRDAELSGGADCHRVRLVHVARGEGANGRSTSEQNGQGPPVRTESAFHIIHGSTRCESIVIEYAVMNGQGAFRVLEGHAEKGR